MMSDKSWLMSAEKAKVSASAAGGAAAAAGSAMVLKLFVTLSVMSAFRGEA